MSCARSEPKCKAGQWFCVAQFGVAAKDAGSEVGRDCLAHALDTAVAPRVDKILAPERKRQTYQASLYMPEADAAALEASFLAAYAARRKELKAAVMTARDAEAARRERERAELEAAAEATRKAAAEAAAALDARICGERARWRALEREGARFFVTSKQRFQAELLCWDHAEAARTIGRAGSQLQSLWAAAPGCKIDFCNDRTKLYVCGEEYADVLNGFDVCSEFRESISAFAGTPKFHASIPFAGVGFGPVCGIDGVVKHSLQDTYKVRLVFKTKTDEVVVLGNTEDLFNDACREVCRRLLDAATKSKQKQLRRLWERNGVAFSVELSDEAK